MPKKHQRNFENFENWLRNKFSKLKFLESALILRIFYAAVQSGCFFGIGTIFINPYFQNVENSSRNFS